MECLNCPIQAVDGCSGGRCSVWDVGCLTSEQGSKEHPLAAILEATACHDKVHAFTATTIMCI